MTYLETNCYADPVRDPSVKVVGTPVQWNMTHFIITFAAGRGFGNYNARIKDFSEKGKLVATVNKVVGCSIDVFACGITHFTCTHLKVNPLCAFTTHSTV